LWEIPGLFIPSDAYYKCDDTDWSDEGQEALLREKAKFLWKCTFADFGTRRRRNFQAQDRAVRILKDNPGFVGTSNVYLALKYGVKPLGTTAHEFTISCQVLSGIRHCNRAALEAWNDVYKGNLGIALPDTIGSDAFFADFNGVLSRLFDGTRHDSGDPYEYGEKAIAHYEKLGINPLSKVIIFSDGLRANVDAAPDKNPEKIRQYFEGRIKVSFGIGTDFTNDFLESPALNIVIKPYTVNGIPVVKLSDSPGKAMGDKDALRVTRWLVNGTPLD
jgi:nicotinate phosphoribosyltransferase